MSKKHWNYRLMYDDKYDSVAVHSVHYENNVPVAYSDKPVELIYGIDDYNEWLSVDLNDIQKAMKKPILCIGEKFPQEYNYES